MELAASGEFREARGRGAVVLVDSIDADVVESVAAPADPLAVPTADSVSPLHASAPASENGALIGIASARLSP